MPRFAPNASSRSNASDARAATARRDIAGNGSGRASAAGSRPGARGRSHGRADFADRPSVRTRARRHTHVRAHGSDGALVLAPAAQPAAPQTLVLLVAGIFAYLLFLGLGAVLLGVTGLSASEAGAVPAALVGLAAIVVCLAIVGRGRHELYGYIAIAAVLAVCALAGHSAYVGGGAQVLNGLQVVAGQRTGVYQLPFQVAAGGSAPFFVCWCAAVLGIICAQMALRGNVVLVTVVGLAAAALVLLGLAGFGWWMVPLAIGAFGCFALNLQAMNHATSSRALASSIVAALVASAAVCGVTVGINQAAPLDVQPAHTALVQAIDNALYGSGYALPAGKLHDVGAFEPTDRAALTASGTYDADRNHIYLRGFVGEQFGNDTWRALDADDVTASEGLFYWLGQDGFSTTAQLADAASATGFDEVSDAQMTITLQGARAPYAYLPYSYKSGGGDADAGGDVEQTTDMASTIAPSGTQTMTFATSEPALAKAYRIQERVSLANGSDSGDAGSGDAPASGATGDAAADGTDKPQPATYLADESSYRDFVYANYLAIPQGVADTFQDIFGDPEQLQPDEAKQRITDFLDKNTTYNADAATSDDGSNIVTDFLTHTGQGYSVHYATTAALLLRWYGVPARYVEGYLVQPEGDDVHDDGTFTTQVTERDAHAWVEYYLDGAGWIVYDPTPGFADDAQYDPTDNAQTSDQSQQDQAGSDSESWSAQIMQDDTQNDQDNDNNDQQTTPVALAWRILMLIIGIIVGFVAWMLIRGLVLVPRQMRRMQDRFEHGPADEQVPLAFSYALALARRALRLRLANEPYPTQGELVESSGVCDAATFVAAARANEHAMLGGGATEADREAVLALLAAVRTSIKERGTRWRRFVTHWLLAMR